MSWVIAAVQPTYTWEELRAMLQQMSLPVETVYRALGGPEEEPSTHGAWEWLEKKTDPSEVIGFMMYEFKELPEPDQNIAEEERRKTMNKGHYNPETHEKRRMAEWVEVSELTALSQDEPPTEQEQRLGIYVRELRNGGYIATDLFGWGIRMHDGRARNALADVYTRMTARLPYHT